MARARASKCPRLWKVLWFVALWLVAVRIYWSAVSEPRRPDGGRRSGRQQARLSELENGRMVEDKRVAKGHHTEPNLLPQRRPGTQRRSEDDELLLTTRSSTEGVEGSRARPGNQRRSKDDDLLLTTGSGIGGLEGSRGAPRRSPPGIVQTPLATSSVDLARWFPKDGVVDPRNRTDAGSSVWGKHFYPGRTWLDTDGNPIQAHGGGMLYVAETKTFYWYGEIKRGNTSRTISGVPARVDIVGVGCYSSQDLWAWKNEGVVLRATPNNPRSDLHPSHVLERPKVIYNERTRNYVMWMHIDGADYKRASVGVAVAEQPEGPFQYLGSKRPHRSESRDMTVFKDDDGQAYLIYSSEDNSVMHIGKLTADYLDLQGPMVRELINKRREAPAVFKFENLYYMITSGCTGWLPNAAEVHVAISMMGPWHSAGDPCLATDTTFARKTFMSQGTYVQALPGNPTTFVFMADRWKELDLQDSRYVWLPLTVNQPLQNGPEDLPRITVQWLETWELPHNAFNVE